MSLFLKGEYEAVARASHSSETGPNNKRIMNNWAFFCAKWKAQELLKLSKIQENEASAYLNLGCFYLMEKKYREAIILVSERPSLQPEIYVEAYEKMNQKRKPPGDSSL